MPVGPYDTFDECVADNQDKDDPAAFCGWLKEQTMQIEPGEGILPEAYRPADSADVPDGQACSNCVFFIEAQSWCTWWDAAVEADHYCDAWRDNEQPVEEDDEPADEDAETASAFEVLSGLTADERTPNDGMATEAQRGLDWRADGNPGGEDATAGRARSIASRNPLSVETIRRMNRFFLRNASYPDNEGFSPGDDGYPSRARVAWALWGGNAGKSWSARLVAKMDRESMSASAGRRMWEGVIAVEGKPTGDGRMMARGSLHWQDLPIPLGWVKEDQGEHMGAITVGRVLEMWRDGDNIMARGDIDLGSADGIEFARLVEGDENGPITNGVSVDLDDVDIELRMKAELWVEGPEVEEDEETEETEQPVARNAAQKALTFHGDHDQSTHAHGAGVKGIRNRAQSIKRQATEANRAANQIEDREDRADAKQEIRGAREMAQAALDEIKGARDGDISDEDIEFLNGELEEAEARLDDAANYSGVKIARFQDENEDERVTVYEESVEDELMVITEARIRGLTAVRIPAFAEARIFVSDQPVEEMVVDDEAVVDEEDEMVASSAPVKPPSSWFTNPNFGSSPSSDSRLVKDPNTGVIACPITVTEDGRVFGHIAPWKACHTAYAECVSPPASAAAYQYFHTGVVDTSDGKQVTVGHMTMNTSHAGRKLSAVDTSFHYEHTGTVVADVRAGEDQYGIWVSGALRPHLSAEQVREFKSAPPSGDWRRIGSSLELVAVLAVNAPGFMVPRAMVASGNVQTLQTAVPTPVRRPSRNKFVLTPQMLALKAKVHMRTLRLQAV